MYFFLSQNLLSQQRVCRYNTGWMQAFGLLHFGYYAMHYFFASQVGAALLTPAMQLPLGFS
jgi:hypothetical protein